MAEALMRDLLERAEGRDRVLVAIAGPPASGKSTLAEALLGRLHAAGESAGLVPMDGFHLDNADLDRMGRRHRKGAPDTFDLPAFTALVHRIQTRQTTTPPIFDRTRDKALPGTDLVLGSDRFVIFEGNYLLLDAPGWRDLITYWNITVFLDVPEPVLEARLMARWGGMAEEDARAKVAGNDLPNARTVLRQRLPADIILTPS